MAFNSALITSETSKESIKLAIESLVILALVLVSPFNAS